ncbi:MAG: response regulator [Prevotellaceae bacterium]|nr:response regulator [Prevotellaceae bacterium]
MKTKLILFFLLCAGSLHAQSYRLLSAGNELSNSSTSQILQDYKGRVWISSTEGGLTRYDGVKFKHYENNRSDSTSLAADYVQTMFQDSNNRLWIGTIYGLQLYDPPTDSFQDIPLIHDGRQIFAHVTSIAERHDGELLVGTSGYGTFHVKDGQMQGQRSTIYTPSFIDGILEDGNRQVWIITANQGLYRYDEENRASVYFKEQNAWTPITAICMDGEGGLYIGGFDIGLWHYKEGTFQEIDTSIPVNTLTYIPGEHKLCIGTDGYGLKIYCPDTHALSDYELDIPTFDFKKVKIGSMLYDRLGNLWLGVYQKGVVVVPFASTGFHTIGYGHSRHDLIGSNPVWSICKAHDGRFWVGTDNDGLYAVDMASGQSRHYAPGQVPPTVMCILEDSRHTLWIGSYKRGLARFNPATGQCTYMRQLVNGQGEYVRRISSLVQDRRGHVWIGTMGEGLFRMNLNTEEIVDYNIIDSAKVDLLSNYAVNCLEYAPDGKLFIGTYDGLFCLDLKKNSYLTQWGTKKLLNGQVIHALYQASPDTLWVGTIDGLVCMNIKTGATDLYTTSHGLCSNTIRSISASEDGKLWLGTNRGLCKFDTRTHECVNFYESDGLQGNEFNRGATFIDADGTVYLGGNNGITYFRPEEVNTVVQEPEVSVSDFYINNKAITQATLSGGRPIVKTVVNDAGKFSLAYTDNSFSIEFTVGELYDPGHIIYSYAVNDNEWITLLPGNSSISFSNLAAGDYRLQVKAENHGVASRVKTLRVTVRPPWYASALAKTLYVVLALAVIYYTVWILRRHYKRKQQRLVAAHEREINEAKLQFFINIAHEIRTPISLIISPVQKLLAMDKDAGRNKLYHTVYRNADRLLKLVNQLMDIRKIDKGQMQLKFSEVEMVSYLKDLYETLWEQAGVKQFDYKYLTTCEAVNVYVDPANFDKIVLNLLYNAFKYTPDGGTVLLQLATGEDTSLTADNPLGHYVEISVTDNGIGIPDAEKAQIFSRFYQIHNDLNNAKPGTGIGLHLTHSLVILHHGTIRVDDNPEGSGSRFTVRLPLGKAHLKPAELNGSGAPVQHRPDAALPAVETSGEAKPSERGKYHVLIAEDDDETRRYVAGELRQKYRVTECRDGKEAWASIQALCPHLVISDVMMPGMDGLTLSSKIKQHVNYNHIPVVLLTAKAGDKENLEGLGTGADAYITKPFNMDILQKTVSNLIHEREQLKNIYTGQQSQEDRLDKMELQSPDDKLLERIVKIVNEHLGDPSLTVEMIADEVGLSRVHLHRKMKELTNQTTRSFIRNVRLQQAAKLLLSGRGKQYVSEVAERVGFGNVISFSSAFKDHFGVSPTEYAAQHGKEGGAK